MACICDKPLTEYVLVYVTDPSKYVNHDWIKAHGVIVDFAEREHPLLKWNDYSDARIIYALNIGEAFRLVEFEEGDRQKEPLHRILDEDREVIHPCLVKDATIQNLHQMVLERFLADNGNERSSGVSQTELSGAT